MHVEAIDLRLTRPGSWSCDVDVAVIGAGVTGLLISLGLRAAGIDVLLIERGIIGAGQSSASHGYLHRGFAYGPGENVTGPMSAAGQYWVHLVDGALVSDTAYASFSDEETAARVSARWRVDGLTYSDVKPPAFLRGIARSFMTGEQCIDVGRLLSGLANEARASGVEILEGVEAGSTTPRHGGIAVGRKFPSGHKGPSLSARKIVVAAGAGAPEITHGPFGVKIERRRCYMSAFEGSVPLASFIFPEHRRYGLFIAPRIGRSEKEVVWLVSDFHSFADSLRPDPGLSDWWEGHIARSLETVLSQEVWNTLKMLGTYSEVKSGIQPALGTVSPDMGYYDPEQDVIVAAPSKLTLAPLAAEWAVEECLNQLGKSQARQGVVLKYLSSNPRRATGPQTVQERWQQFGALNGF